jgi:hypothetical protein
MIEFLKKYDFCAFAEGRNLVNPTIFSKLAKLDSDLFES